MNRSSVLVIAAGAVFGLTFATTSVAATKWIMASGYPEDSFLTQSDRYFIKEIETKSGGELTVDLRSNNSLLKLATVKRAVQSGHIQVGEIRMGIYGNESPMYILDSLPNIASDYESAWKLMEAEKPFFDKLFAKNGMKIVAYMAWPGQGLYTKFPLKTPDDFTGVKMRIYSKATQTMGEMLGFETTILPFAEVPQAFSTGLIESLFTSAQTGIDIQAWDYVKHFMYTGTMHNKNAIVINEMAFSALSPKLQKIVLDAGESTTKYAWKLSEKFDGEQIDVLRKNGMTISPATSEIAARFADVGEAMMTEWSKTASPEENAILDVYLKSLKK